MITLTPFLRHSRLWKPILSLSRPFTALQRPPDLKAEDLNASPENTSQARAWIKYFSTADIPKHYVEMTFSRSSGPGGQNVNKVNTKATVKCDIYQSWIPAWARPSLMKTPFYAASSKALLIKSDVSRSQSSNATDCMDKLHDVILSAASSDIRNETSLETKKRVAEHEKKAEARRKTDKMKRSMLKQSRKGDDW